MSEVVAHPAPAESWLSRSGDFLFRWRNWVFPAVVLLTCFVLPATLPFDSALADATFDALGFGIVGLGLCLRAAVIGYVYIRRGGVNKRVYANELVTSGFFAMSRNPLYCGNLLIYGGLLLIHHNPISYVIGLSFFAFAYRAIVSAEERYLGSRFGQAYDDYCAATPRWWPDFSRRRTALAGMAFHWRRVVAKDYSTIVPAVLVGLTLVALEDVRWRGWNGAGLDLALYAGIAVVVIVMGLSARVAKKSGALRD